MAASAPARPSVLVVEDDDAVRRGLLLLLRSRGYEVKAHASAVGLARDGAALGCGCIVADLMMPQIDALQMLAEFHDAGWDGKAILISGFLDPRWEEKARAAGFDVVLPKPISDSVLVRTVEELLPNASRVR
jgi:FixJ family two-component response regulator